MSKPAANRLQTKIKIIRYQNSCYDIPSPSSLIFVTYNGPPPSTAKWVICSSNSALNNDDSNSSADTPRIGGRRDIKNERIMPGSKVAGAGDTVPLVPLVSGGGNVLPFVCGTVGAGDRGGKGEIGGWETSIIAISLFSVSKKSKRTGYIKEFAGSCR